MESPSSANSNRHFSPVNPRQLSRVHKNWVTPIKDCYFIDIDDGCDDKALALMVVIGLEDMSED